MAYLVYNGAMLHCSMGICPTSLNIIPKAQTYYMNQPIATTMDNVPMVNILPFGMCHSMANPMVAAATAAALGVLTPMPCIPSTCGCWITGKPSVIIGGYPSLTSDSKLMCAYGGVISIIYSGQYSSITTD